MKDLFNVAVGKLGLSVEAEDTLTIGDEFITVIKISNLPAKTSLQRETKQFYGEFASTDVLSIQSACAYHVALSFLEKERFVVINK